MNKTPKKRTKPESKLVGLTEAASVCGVCTRTIRRYISAGKIAAYRVGPRLIRVDPDELNRVMYRIGRAV